ncbi:MAG: sterol desaturase family protein [Chitinophagales bacterium]
MDFPLFSQLMNCGKIGILVPIRLTLPDFFFQPNNTTMDAYAKVLLIAIPGFILLMIVEWLYSLWKGKSTFRSMDTIASLSSGSTNTLKSILKLSIVIISYDWLVGKVALFHIEITWVVWVLSFIAIDFASYWSHRLSHSINIFWNRHVVHHSSEEFNLACALRQTISDFVSLGFIFLFPAALLGLPAEVIAVIAPIHLFMQFWYHTTLIPKLGWLEYIIVTPSQHRVHHAINDIYLDKNLSAIFCIWDRMFGTFQEELDEVPCVYGVKRAAQTWNPIRINFQHLWILTQDAWRTEKWWDKIRLWFMPTGWRPADMLEKYPLDYTKDAYSQVKYDTDASKAFHVWSWYQYIMLTFLMVHMLLFIGDFEPVALLAYGGFLFLMIYSYTTLMDRDSTALWLEIAKALTGFGIIYYWGDWFLLDKMMAGGTTFMMVYLIASVVGVAYFVQYEIKKPSIGNLQPSKLSD